MLRQNGLQECGGFSAPIIHASNGQDDGLQIGGVQDNFCPPQQPQAPRQRPGGFSDEPRNAGGDERYGRREPPLPIFWPPPWENQSCPPSYNAAPPYERLVGDRAPFNNNNNNRPVPMPQSMPYREPRPQAFTNSQQPPHFANSGHQQGQNGPQQVQRRPGGFSDERRHGGGDERFGRRGPPMGQRGQRMPSPPRHNGGPRGFPPYERRYGNDRPPYNNNNNSNRPPPMSSSSMAYRKPRAQGFTNSQPSHYGNSGHNQQYGFQNDQMTDGNRGNVAGLSCDFSQLCQIAPVNWSHQAEKPPIQKNFYTESEAVKERSEEEMTDWIEEHQILLHGENIPRPCFEFEEPGLPPTIVEMLQRSFDKPTLIQCISWPVALSGQDMVSIARTGSGKTLGFILPAIVHTLNQERRGPGQGPSVLVLLPTRELAQQACDVARDYCVATGLSVTSVFGGVPKDQQGDDLRRGVDICIATPGRLLAFIHSRTVSLDRCTFLVLDEADRMLEMGFEDQIRAIVSQIRPDRQTLMFSATWPMEVRQFAKNFQTAPVFLNVGSLELSANHNINQHIEVMDESDKANRLEQLLIDVLDKTTDGKVIVFFDTKRKADELEDRLRHKWRVLCIHGDKCQAMRDQVMEDFKTGRVRVLLATDIAARGLDVCNVEAVINFDYPMSTEQYVHRIGRTARHDKKGSAFTFFTPQNSQKAADLIKVLEEAKQTVPADLRDLAFPQNNSRHYFGL